jgi:asparagine synthase (glutamine-hydrolysing)
MAEWFRGPLRDLLEETLSPAALQVLPELRPSAVRQLMDEHVAGQANHAFKLWGLVTLARWARVHAR